MAIEDIFTLERFQERSRKEALGKGIFVNPKGKRLGTVSADILESEVYKKAVTENYYQQLAKLKQLTAGSPALGKNIASMEVVTRPFFSQSQYQSLLGAAEGRKTSEEYAATVLSAKKKTGVGGRASTILGNPQTFLGTNMRNIGG